MARRSISPSLGRHWPVWLAMVLLLGLAACGSGNPGPANSSGADQLRAVATTTIVGDVVRQVTGDHVDLTVLLPVGTDPHSFDPAPADVAAVADADVVFANGLGLEEFLQPLLDNAGGHARVVTVSDGIQPLQLGAQDQHDGEHQAGEDDPHVWTDPNNVMVWTTNIASALSQIDPAGAAVYRANAEQYTEQLQALDGWIQQQVAQVPEANRQLVTDHAVFGYFARRYGFQQAGTVIPGYSTLASPSAQELAALEQAITTLGVKAIFVGHSVNPSLAERVAGDTGTRLVFVYTGSLGEPGGEAATYLNYMRYDVDAVVSALK